MELIIKSEDFENEDLMAYLNTALAGNSSKIQILLREPEQSYRSIDATVLVAIISSASTMLGTLLTLLIEHAKKSETRVIELHDKDGRVLKFPADSSPEKIERLLATIKKMDTPTILIP